MVGTGGMWFFPLFSLLLLTGSSLFFKLCQICVVGQCQSCKQAKEQACDCDPHRARGFEKSRKSRPASHNRLNLQNVVEGGSRTSCVRFLAVVSSGIGNLGFQVLR